MIDVTNDYCEMRLLMTGLSSSSCKPHVDVRNTPWWKPVTYDSIPYFIALGPTVGSSPPSAYRLQEAICPGRSSGRDMKLIDVNQYVELYLHFRVRLHGLVLN